MNPIISFDTTGKPITQGSKRAWVNPGTGKVMMKEDQGNLLTSWRFELLRAAQRAMQAKSVVAPTSAPIRVVLTFYVFRPGHHYGTGKNERVLKPSAPGYPHGRVGDVDKLTRAVLDSLTDARVFIDDCQVVDLHARKRWADRYTGTEGVSVDVGALE